MTPHDEALQARTAWLREQVNADLPLSPDLLWHYTDAGGLLGIVQDELLWATDTRFLNDATELHYGLDLARDSLRGYAAHAGLKLNTVRFLTGLADPDQADVPGFLRAHLDIYVTCFCQDGDLLSQWRAYAGRDSAGGYALGIGTRPPLQGWVHQAGQDHGLRLRRVLYDPDEQRAAIDNLLQHLVPILDVDPDDDERRTAVASDLVNALLDFAVCCKHFAFAEEQEWRIVYDRSSDPNRLSLPLQHRPRRGLLVPYVELALPSPIGALTGHLPLKEINCGPGPDPCLKEHGVRSLLDCYQQFSAVTLKGSGTPLRL